MVKRIVLLLAAIAMMASAHAATITLSDASGHPGDDVTVTIDLSSTVAVSAIDITLPLADNLKYVDGSIRLSSRAPGHQVSASNVNGALRIVIYSLDLSPIQGTSGIVADFSLRLGNAPGTTTLNPAVVLADAAGASISANVVPGSATSLCPQLTVVSTRIDYGRVPIRSRYTASLTLCNSGNEPLTISSLSATSAMLSFESSTATIAPGESYDFTLVFEPETRGAFTDRVTIVSNAVNDLVHGVRNSVEVVADPFSVNELHILQTHGVSDSRATVAVCVNNMEPLVGAQFSINLPDGIRYIDGSVATCDRTSGMTASASVSANKLTLILYSMQNLAMTGNDGDILTFDVCLEGRSGSYYLNPESVLLANVDMDDMTSAAEGNYVIIQSPTINAASRLDFGFHPIGKPYTVDYTVTNDGQTDLIIDRVNFLDESFALSTTLPLTIPPYSSTKFAVTHTSDEAGDFNSVMNLYSNDPECRVKAVEINGSAFVDNQLGISGYYTGADCDHAIDIELSNALPVVAVQFDISVDGILPADLPSITAVPRNVDHNASIYKMADDKYRVLIFSMCNSALCGNDGLVASIRFPGDGTAVAGTFAIDNVVISASGSTNAVSPVFSLPQTLAFTVPALGDANTDDDITVTDSMVLINNILNKPLPTVYCAFAADSDCSGDISVTDAMKIVELILNK